MASDSPDWSSRPDVPLSNPSLPFGGRVHGLNQAGSPQTLFAFTCAQTIGLNNVLLTAICRTAGASGYLAFDLVNTSRAGSVSLTGAVVSDLAPLVVASGVPFDIGGALAAVNAQVGDAIEFRVSATNTIGTPVFDVSYQAYYTTG